MTEAGTSGGDSLREKWPVWLLFVAVAVSLLLLVLTLAASDASVPRVCRRLLRLFSLRSENNFGAWWSGILLFLPALLAIDAAMAERANPARARGWYVLSAIFLALSADEIGSIHERVGNDGWLYLLPFGIVFLGLAVYALYVIGKDPDTRRIAFGIAVGFALFGMVAVQEFVEHKVTWPQRLIGIRAVTEEGTELLAMILLLEVFVRRVRKRVIEETGGPYPSLDVLTRGRSLIPAGVIVLTPLVAYVSARFTDKTRGHPADWLAAVLFCACALLACRPGLVHERRIGRRDRFLAVTCLLASMCSVVLLRRYTLDIGIGELNLSALMFTLIACVAGGLAISRQRPVRREHVLIHAGLILVGVGLLTSDNLFLLYFFPPLVASGIYRVQTISEERD